MTLKPLYNGSTCLPAIASAVNDELNRNLDACDYRKAPMF